MRGKKAKGLRKAVYGDRSLKDRKYKFLKINKGVTAVADRFRGTYQRAKRGITNCRTCALAQACSTPACPITAARGR